MDKTKEDITIEEIRQLQGYGNLSEEELQRITESIKELALLIFIVCPEVNISRK